MSEVHILSRIYLTADAHFGHANIARYCKRPPLKREYLNEFGHFVSPEIAIQCAEEMNAWLVAKWNSRVKEGDLVYHIGDFVNYGSNRGTKGCRLKPTEYEEMLNGKIMHIWGNHDPNNGLKGALSSAVLLHGGIRMLLRHIPTDDAAGCDCVVCGHVHDQWKHKWINGVLNINVGLDAHKWSPLRSDEVVGMYFRARRELKDASN